MAEEFVALDEVRRVTNQELIVRMRSLVRADQAFNARLLVHLGEVEARGLYRDQAYSSMFAYCVEELGMFEHQAFLRLQAARLGRRFPRILELLSQGALHLSGIKLLAPHLTADNHVQLLERASGKSKREIELLVVEIAPKPDVPSRMRKLPEPRGSRTEAPCAPLHPDIQVMPTSAPVDASQTHASGSPSQTHPSGTHASGSPSAPPAVCDSNRAPFALEAPRPRGSSEPLSPGRYKVEFTAGQALHRKLEQLQELLRHQVPDADLATIVERAVDLLIDDTMKRRFAQTRAPKTRRWAKPRNANSRYVPRAVVREVHQRDAGQCTFVSAEGKRCEERGFLELHHHGRTYARGGEATVENLRLVCRAHNALFAERDYGRTFIRSKLRQAISARNEFKLDPRVR